MLSITVGWSRGGHPERFGALVLLLDYLASMVGEQWQIREIVVFALTLDLAVMLAFAWLALKADRWWPIAVAASLALCVLVRIVGIVNPDLSRFAMLSAALGIWILIYVFTIAGVAERWLAGEPAAADGKTWRPRRPAGRAT